MLFYFSIASPRVGLHPGGQCYSCHMCRRMAVCASSLPHVPARGRLEVKCVPAHGRVCQLIAECAGAWPSRSQTGQQTEHLRFSCTVLLPFSPLQFSSQCTHSPFAVTYILSGIFTFGSVCAVLSLVAVANLLLHSFMPNQMRVANESSIEQPAP